jgi:hypothetical protein
LRIVVIEVAAAAPPTIFNTPPPLVFQNSAH